VFTSEFIGDEERQMRDVDETMWQSFVIELRESGVEFDAGLTDFEVSNVEARFGFRFPPDLRAFLQIGLPRGERFPDWRFGSETGLQECFDFPLRGILPNVLEYGFWLDEWGTRPASDDDVGQMVTKLFRAAPRLIPIICGSWCSHMMPAEPNSPGNPVFAVRYTDIVYRGLNLRDYLIHEFLAREDVNLWPMPSSVRPIAFWDVERFHEGNRRLSSRSN
jgi:hypothetical protein